MFERMLNEKSSMVSWTSESVSTKHELCRQIITSIRLQVKESAESYVSDLHDNASERARDQKFALDIEKDPCPFVIGEIVASLFNGWRWEKVRA